MKKIVRSGWVLAVATIVCTSAVADDLEALEKKIHDKSKAIKSLKADSKTVTNMATEGFKMESESVGTYECLKNDDGKLMLRMESKDKSKTEVAGQTTNTESTMLMISDGTTTYTLSDAAGVKSASKTVQGDWDVAPFSTYRDMYTIKQLPDEKFDGNSVWVFEMTPKDVNAAQMSKMVIAYHKECGWPVRTITYGTDGKEMSKSTMTNVRLNEKISPDRFVFKAPPGVEITDYSNIQQQYGTPDES